MFHRTFSLFALAAVFNADLAAAQQFPGPDNPWIAPGEGDVRSPCPFINTLANHGLIDRTGKNVDLFAMVPILSSTFDTATPLLQGLSSAAVGFGWTTTDSNGTVRLSLDEMFAHNKQEHDASIARVDDYFGAERSRPVDETLLDELMNTNPNSDVLTMQDMMDRQYARILDSRYNNPAVNITMGGQGSLSAQATLFMVLGQDPELGFVDKQRIDELLRFERIPAGYTPKIITDPNNFSPFDITNPNDISASVRAKFAENIKMALAEPLTTSPTAAPSAAAAPRAVVVLATLFLATVTAVAAF